MHSASEHSEFVIVRLPSKPHFRYLSTSRVEMNKLTLDTDVQDVLEDAVTLLNTVIADGDVRHIVDGASLDRTFHCIQFSHGITAAVDIDHIDRSIITTIGEKVWTLRTRIIELARVLDLHEEASERRRTLRHGLRDAIVYHSLIAEDEKRVKQSEKRYHQLSLDLEGDIDQLMSDLAYMRVRAVKFQTAETTHVMKMPIPHKDVRAGIRAIVRSG